MARKRPRNPNAYSHVDPLEAAKDAVPEEEREEGAVNFELPGAVMTDEEWDADLAAEAERLAEKERAMEAAEDSRVVVAAPPEPQKRFIVQRKISIYWNGQFITLQAGADVSPKYYGSGCVEKMRDSGVDIREED